MTTRYACTGCSFATSDADRMLGHAHATGHLSGKPAPHPLANCGPLTLPLPPGVHCPTCGVVPEPASPSAALADRRQRAREAAFDDIREHRVPVDAAPSVEAAIDTATRVQITPEIVATARQIATEQMHDPQAPTDPAERWKVILTAAFRAAGFEVEE